MRAYAPDGTLITGTKEIVPGEACVCPDSFRLDGEGKIQFDHLGHTEMDWDNQRTVLKDEKLVFIDADGDEWTEDQITLRDE